MLLKVWVPFTFQAYFSIYMINSAQSPKGATIDIQLKLANIQLFYLHTVGLLAKKYIFNIYYAQNGASSRGNMLKYVKSAYFSVHGYTTTIENKSISSRRNWDKSTKITHFRKISQLHWAISTYFKNHALVQRLRGESIEYSTALY